MVAQVLAAHGRIDYLVNSAGLTARHAARHHAGAVRRAHRGEPARSVLPHAGSGAFPRGGRTAWNGRQHHHDVAACRQPFLAPYVASKAGLAGLTRNAAHAHRWDRIRINGLNVGWTDTEGEDSIQREFHDDRWLEEAAKAQPMGKLGQVDEIAAMVVLLLSDRSGVVTGSVIDWDQIVIGGLD